MATYPHQQLPLSSLASSRAWSPISLQFPDHPGQLTEKQPCRPEWGCARHHAGSVGRAGAHAGRRSLGQCWRALLHHPAQGLQEVSRAGLCGPRQFCRPCQPWAGMPWLAHNSPALAVPAEAAFVCCSLSLSGYVWSPPVTQMGSCRLRKLLSILQELVHSRSICKQETCTPRWPAMQS